MGQTDFQSLRMIAIRQTEQDTAERITTNPVPTEVELQIGAFAEEMEPQVRAAVLEMNRKGYATESSGFAGEHGELQMVDGYFEIDEHTKALLADHNVHVLKGPDLGFPYWDMRYTFVQFAPPRPDLEHIKKTWDEVANLLPAQEEIAVSITGAAEDFRKQYAPERTDIEKLALQKMLALGQDQWEPTMWAELNQRFAALTTD